MPATSIAGLGVAGAVLAGGASRRMGRTKALIDVAGIPMATRVGGALLDAGCDPVIVYGGDPTELEPLGLPVVPDRYPGAGPLGGVLGLLERFAETTTVTHVAVVACDLPALTGAALAPVIAAAQQHSDLDVVAARTNRLEPACAVWRLAALVGVRSLFDRGERALHTAIDELASTEVEVPADALVNINTPDDLGRYP